MPRKNKSKRRERADVQLLISTLVLVAVGLVAVADASAPIAVRDFADKFYFIKQQIVWAGVGVLLLLIFSKIHYQFWEKVATYLFVGNVIILIVVLLPGFGSRLLGAKRWLDLGFFSLQPSELVKLTLSLYMAKIVTKDIEVYKLFLPIALVAFLIMLQPDLGTTVLVAGIAMVQIYISGVSIIPVLGVLATSVILGLLLIVTSSYRRDRLMTFVTQTQDPLGKSYHIRQVLLALGTGGFWGVGLGQSRQKYLFLPETATDSIFAVIAEEVGFVGALLLVLGLFFYVYKALKVVSGAPDKFSQVLSAGLTTWIGGQIFLNIASMVAIVPLTGIPLPFISYGGSSLVTALVATGILLNISSYGAGSKKR